MAKKDSKKTPSKKKSSKSAPKKKPSGKKAARKSSPKAAEKEAVKPAKQMEPGAPKRSETEKVANLDLLHDPLIRSGAVAAFAMFTLILLLPIAPCKSVPVRDGFSGEVWDVCGKDGWDAMTPGFTLDGVDTYLLGSISLTRPERWFIFAGVFGLFYLLYLKLYNDFVDYLTS